ncbi:HGxxPAAW family protein [Streptomyces sp. WAC07094]|uniref:HGxxPAAW family protein n=1 Tax=Streptomyces sp. WAC07094 TaxID=3072183 RepID=UPI002EAC4A72|nr:HGxxPAAW family protein [Streptomyces sp. WAC07094]
MSIHGDDAYDLGHTAAGWTGTAVATLGSGLCALGVITTWKALVFAGSGVLVLALLITWALHLAGWGKPSGPRPVEQWYWRVRDTSAREGHPDCLGCRLAGRRGARRTHPMAAVEPAECDFQVTDSTPA